jgi:hypothetical protein
MKGAIGGREKGADNLRGRIQWRRRGSDGGVEEWIRRSSSMRQRASRGRTAQDLRVSEVIFSISPVPHP